MADASLYAAFAAVLVGLYVWLLARDRALRSDEPPYYPYLIPGLGHALQYGENQPFYFRVSKYFRSRKPYSIRFPGSKAYVVSDPDDITTVYRNATALSFDTYIERGIAHVYGVQPSVLGSPAGSPTLRDVVKGGTAANGTVVENSHVYSRRYLLQEGSLNDLTRRTALEIARALDEQHTGKEMEVGLHQWSRTFLPQAVTNAIYGPGLLKAHPELIEKVWKFDDTFHHILTRPPFLNKEVLQTREDLYRIFADYVGDDDRSEQMREGAFGLATERGEILKEGGSSVMMRAGCEIPLFHALHANATPTAFFVLAYISSIPGLSDRILEEIRPAFRTSESEDEPDVDITYLTSVKTCPLIHSCLYEAMRLTSGSLSTRRVEKKTVIGPYTVYPYNSVFVPSRVAHLAEDHWGPTVHEFDPDRFIKHPEELRPGNMWLRPFGGGATICPGRNFAGNEVKLFVAGVMRRFEVKFKPGDKVPSVDNNTPSAGMMKPAHDIVVRLVPREPPL